MTVNKYLSIITLNVNGLNAPIKRHTIAEWIRTWPTHMLPTRDPPQNKRPTQTEREGLETNISSKWSGKKKKSKGSNTHITQKILKKKGHKERPRRTLHNRQRKDPSRRHKHCKYICTQHRSTQIQKENLGGLQERYWQQHNYSRGF